MKDFAIASLVIIIAIVTIALLGLLALIPSPLNDIMNNKTTNKNQMLEQNTVAYYPRNTTIANALKKAYEQKQNTYDLETQHLEQNKPLFTNRLLLETSPYLLQHAHNPVDWFAWNEEAFALAKKYNRPIFLSIGYSTCHWCHVMAKQSFDNKEVANFLNSHFVPIKLDREVRPDLDSFYMSAVQLITGSGGWPMSVFLTPDGEPIFGGTYYPKDQFLQMLKAISKAWATKKDKLEQQAKMLMAKSTAIHNQTQQLTANKNIIASLNANILKSADLLQGGFNTAPKFPQESLLLFIANYLLGQTNIDDSQQELAQVLTTSLDAMQQGGIFDQVGGGFHRYSIDNSWLVPHFEKMLYNQAALAEVYLLAYQLNANTSYLLTAKRTLDYALTQTNDQGLFYAATDADSEGEEGVFFTWTLNELQAVLTKQEYKLAVDIYGASADGNFEGTNILHLPKSLSSYAKQQGLTKPQLIKDLTKINNALYAKRQTRIAPHTDTKIITAWNAMMLNSLSKAALLLDDNKYLQAALLTANSLWQQQYDSKKGLLRIANSTDYKQSALDDYANLALAYISLYDASGNALWLDRSKILLSEMIVKFSDKSAPDTVFFMNQKADSKTILLKDTTDGAVASGNSIALQALVQFNKRTEDTIFHKQTMDLMSGLMPSWQNYPMSSGYGITGYFLSDKQTGGQQWAGGGHVKATLKHKKSSLQLTINMDPDWHINSNKPLQKDLIATTVQPILLNQANENNNIATSKINYPNGTTKTLSFSKEPISIYENQITINIPIADNYLPHQLFVKVNLQACSNKICLAPTTLMLRAMPPANHAKQ